MKNICRSKKQIVVSRTRQISFIVVAGITVMFCWYPRPIATVYYLLWNHMPCLMAGSTLRGNDGPLNNIQELFVPHFIRLLMICPLHFPCVQIFFCCRLLYFIDIKKMKGILLTNKRKKRKNTVNKRRNKTLLSSSAKATTIQY